MFSHPQSFRENLFTSQSGLISLADNEYDNIDKGYHVNSFGGFHNNGYHRVGNQNRRMFRHPKYFREYPFASRSGLISSADYDYHDIDKGYHVNNFHGGFHNDGYHSGGYHNHGYGYYDCCPLVVDTLSYAALIGFIALATYFFSVRIEMSNLMMPAGGGRRLARGLMKGLKKNQGYTD